MSYISEHQIIASAGKFRSILRQGLSHQRYFRKFGKAVGLRNVKNAWRESNRVYPIFHPTRFSTCVYLVICLLETICVPVLVKAANRQTKHIIVDYKLCVDTLVLEEGKKGKSEDAERLSTNLQQFHYPLLCPKIWQGWYKKTWLSSSITTSIQPISN